MRISHLKRRATGISKIWMSDYMISRRLSSDMAYVGCFLQGSLLDIGCGNRPYAPFFSGITKYIGVDIDVFETKADAVCWSNQLPFPSASFSSVLITQVLEHVHTPWKTIEEISRVLKPDGKLIISVPQSWRLHEEPYDFYRYTKYGLKYLLESNNFQILELLPQGGMWCLIGTSIQNGIWKNRWPRKSGKWLLHRIFSVVSSVTINSLSELMEKIWLDDGDTLNYVCLAQKIG